MQKNLLPITAMRLLKVATFLSVCVFTGLIWALG